MSPVNDKRAYQEVIAPCLLHSKNLSENEVNLDDLNIQINNSLKEPQRKYCKKDGNKGSKISQNSKDLMKKGEKW